MLREIATRKDLHPKVLVSVRSDIESFGRILERDAAAVIDWHMPASYSPMNYSISVPNGNGIRDMISRSGAFVVNFMGLGYAEDLEAHAGKDATLLDMWNLMGVSKADSEKVDAPRVKEARAHLECEVIQELEAGDHTVFVGRVLKGG